MKLTCLCSHTFLSTHIMFLCWCSCVNLSIIEKLWFLWQIVSRILTMWFRAESQWHYIMSSWSSVWEKQYEKAFWRRSWQSKIEWVIFSLILTGCSERKWITDRFAFKLICVKLCWLFVDLDQEHDNYCSCFCCEQDEVIVTIALEDYHWSWWEISERLSWCWSDHEQYVLYVDLLGRFN